MANSDSRLPNLALDAAQLYLEETFSDRRVGAIRKLTPVRSDGSPDGSRPVLYTGETQVMTQVGALPIAFNIKADSLEEAVGQFGKLAAEELERTMRELQEMRRQAQSSIVVPQSPGMVPGVGPGKIQLP
jgi:hypothetical protein